jgi:NhaP-type Na+/H+ or K+/H+ antiporter
LLTTAAVAWAGVLFAGLPLAAAITLGAIVAPPDAVAAATVLQRFRLPRRTLAILSGESLLNDAIALLLFGAASSAAMSPGASWSGTLPTLLIAVPGGAVFGYVMARLYIHIPPLVAGTLSSTIVEFVATFAVWVLAERLRLSPILAVVAYGMTIARILPSRSAPRDRVHSYSVWNATVFVLNVLAFLLMGLQARAILAGLQDGALWHALRFAGIVLAVVIGVRIAWLMTYGVLLRALGRYLKAKRGRDIRAPSARIGVLVGWSGMRGLVTLATAFALPPQFPSRDVIVLCAFAVVLGTLIVQGLTIGPLIKLLKIEPDGSLERQVSQARTELMDAAIAALGKERGDAADATRAEYRAARELARDEDHPQEQTEHDRLRTIAIHSQRDVLEKMRDSGRIDDDAYHRLEEELDWAELSAAPADRLRMQSV